MDLHNKVILITGASSGIGKAAALALSRKKNRIIITARRSELLSEVEEQIRANGCEVLAISGDAHDKQLAEDIVNRIVNQFGGIDIALLNVGAGPPLALVEASPDEIIQNMRLNYDTMINYFCPVVQHMKSSGSGGIIANTNSLAGFLGLPMHGQYSAAKAACRVFLDTARIELKTYNIRILTLCPGFVITERNKQKGIPKSLVMSLDEAAEQILKALKSEKSEYLFPLSLKIGILIERSLPKFITNRILNKFLQK